MTPAGRGRIAAGAVLLAAAAALLLSALLFAPRTVRRSAAFAASGREAVCAAPALPRGTVRVNEADAEELDGLRGIGETLADAILAERALHGPFAYPEDLLAVRGIGEKKLADFRGQLDMSP